MSLYDFFVSYLFINILNIPLACIFKKAWINYINAFIPFKNIVSYLEVLGIRDKYFCSFIVAFASFLIYFFIYTFFEDEWLLMGNIDFNFYELFFCFFLLLTIPTYMIFWIITSLVSSIMSFFMFFVMFIWSWNWALGFIISPIILLVSIFFIKFYCKISYKLALRFWWKRKFAILYVIFQPIAAWILAFWKWKYISNCDVVSFSKNNIINGWNQINTNSGVVSNNLNNENWNGVLLSGISTQWDKQFYEEMKNIMLKLGKLILWFILYFIFSFLFLSFLLWAFMIFRILILKYF